MERVAIDLDPDAPVIPAWVPAGSRARQILLDMRWGRFWDTEDVLAHAEDQVIWDTGDEQ